MRDVAAVCDSLDPNGAIGQQYGRVPNSKQLQRATVRPADIGHRVTRNTLLFTWILQIFLKGKN